MMLSIWIAAFPFLKLWNKLFYCQMRYIGELTLIKHCKKSFKTGFIDWIVYLKPYIWCVFSFLNVMCPFHYDSSLSCYLEIMRGWSSMLISLNFQQNQLQTKTGNPSRTSCTLQFNCHPFSSLWYIQHKGHPMNLYDKFAWSHGSTAIDSMSLFHLQRWYTIMFSTTFVDTMSTKNPHTDFRYMEKFWYSYFFWTIFVFHLKKHIIAVNNIGIDRIIIADSVFRVIIVLNNKIKITNISFIMQSACFLLKVVFTQSRQNRKHAQLTKTSCA